jgi:hypothetical protein
MGSGIRLSFVIRTRSVTSSPMNALDGSNATWTLTPFRADRAHSVDAIERAAIADAHSRTTTSPHAIAKIPTMPATYRAICRRSSVSVATPQVSS